MTATHEQIQQRAYQLWEQRGRPLGSPAVDWDHAEQELRGTAEGDAGGMASGTRPQRGPNHQR